MKKNLVIAIGTGVAIGISYWLFVVKGLGKKYNSESTTGSILDTTNDTTAGGVAGNGECVISWPLRRGSGYSNPCENKAVMILQKYLNAKPANSRINVDGKFGMLTEAALYKVSGRKELTEVEFTIIKMPTLLNGLYF